MRSLALLAPGVLLLGMLAVPGTSEAAASFSKPPAAGYGTGKSYCTKYGTNGAMAVYGFQNVYACSPDDTVSSGTPFDQNYSQSFQCFDLSARFLWAKYNIWAGPDSAVADDAKNPRDGDIGGGYLAKAVHEVYPKVPLVSPGPGRVPSPGDVISFGPGGFSDGDVGHTAVVIASTPSNGKFTIMSENLTNGFADGGAGEQHLTVDLSGQHNGYVLGNGVWTPSDWVHFSGTGTPPLGPSAAERPNGEHDIVWRGTSNQLEEETWVSGTGFRGPFNLGMGPLGSEPVVVAPPLGAVSDYVFWEGTDRNVWEAYDASGTWHGPTKVGLGPIASPPAASMWGGQVELWWQGTDGNVWEAYASGSPVTGWVGPTRDTSGGGVGGRPTAVVRANAEEDVFYLGANSRTLWEFTWKPGGTFSTPVNRGMGPLNSPPSATVAAGSSSPVYVYWAGTDGNVWEAIDTSAFAGPTKIAVGPVASAPGASMYGNQVDLWWTGTDNNLWTTYSSGVPAATWQPPVRVTTGGPL